MRQVQPAVGQNFLAGMVGGVQAGQQMRDANDQNALRGLLRTADVNDPAIQQQIMGLDPQVGMQLENRTYQRGRQQKADARTDQLFEMQVAEFAQKADDRQKAEAVQMIEQGLIKGTQLFRAGDLQGLNMMLAEAGEQPIASLEEFPPIAAKYEKVWETLQRTQPEVRKPVSGPGRVQSDIDAGFLPAGTELRSPQVVVNTGDQADPRPMINKPPPGFQYRFDEANNTYLSEPIPGSEQDVDREGANLASQQAAANYQRKFDLVDDKITEAVSMLDSGGRFVAGAGSLLSGLPETGARNFQATIDTIKANLGFEELQAMRDSSPTGGALGQVTEREIAFLQAIQGNLDTAQSPEQLRSVLLDIQQRRSQFQAERERILSGANGGGKASSANPFAGMTDDDLINLDIMSLTPEQQKQALEALSQ